MRTSLFAIGILLCMCAAVQSTVEAACSAPPLDPGDCSCIFMDNLVDCQDMPNSCVQGVLSDYSNCWCEAIDGRFEDANFPGIECEYYEISPKITLSVSAELPIYMSGQPRTYKYTFTGVAGSHTLTVLNGCDDGTTQCDLVSRARIRLNGATIIDWNEVDDAEWTAESVTLLSGNNILEIDNDSSTKAFLSVFIADTSVIP